MGTANADITNVSHRHALHAIVRPMAEPTLFCPFCRESFDGERVCPAHALELVPLHRLGSGLPREGFFDAGVARPLALVGALCTTWAMAAPLVVWASHDASAFRVALEMAPQLWAAVTASWLQCALILRATERQRLRSLWPALVGLPLVAALFMAHALWRLLRLADAQQVQMGVGWGAWLLLAGLGFGLLAGIRAARR